ncbi:hypothetical protein BCR43DRAFT_485401 [Syncephalastrum racemosum]|uniref:Uncharacterized protein n=1 Tax=Syncephalastrum racemosum TaxID=13706 RepID=A0A1X2HMJ5_SYNRA|nr:hypothetical protein BCR43DRAFT_485401 [Syncephalastrum racemosum]
MSKLTQSSPLVHLGQRSAEPVVRKHVDEPFLRRQGSRRTRAVVSLLELLARLDLLARKLQQGSFPQLQEEAKTLATSIQSKWSALAGADPTAKQELIEALRLNSLYGHAMRYLSTSPEDQQSDGFSRHCKQMGQYDQLYATACRLYRHLKLPNHSYIPYQLALVYQCVTQLGSPFKSYRDRIEQQFDDIRQYQTQHPDGRLHPDQVEWLLMLTRELAMQTCVVGPVAVGTEPPTSLPLFDAMHYARHLT